MSPKKEWKKISDSEVVNVWHCQECQINAEINPDFYERNGNPECRNCYEEMDYLNSMILVKP